MKLTKRTLAVASVFIFSFCANNDSEKKNTNTTTSTSNTNNNEERVEAAGITLPKGFSATIFADNLGKARHIAVNSNGDVYAKLDNLYKGNGIVRLHDANKDGVAEDITGFGNYKGTGIAIKNGYLY